MDLDFIPVSKNNIKNVAAIYNYYVAHSTATFHLDEVSIEELYKSLPINDGMYQSFVISSLNNIIGFCYISPFRKKEAYDISAEVTLYLKNELTQKGIGNKVLNFLETHAKLFGVKNLIGVITAENTSSIKLFKKCGYFKAAHLKNIGVKFGRELDVVWYQKEI